VKTSAPLFRDLTVGFTLPELVKRPTTTMLFRFSAVTWNAHRIHYDEGYARSEGHPGVLVPATMHGAFLLEMLMAFCGPEGRVLELAYSNRGKATPADFLTLGGRITALDAAGPVVDCEVWERNQDGLTCAAGTAKVQFP
jgi:hydroxyacyl-ACP dehydratase HTD2-like protein with hotdog domain